MKGGRRRASVAVVTKGLGGLTPAISSNLIDLEPKSRLHSLFSETSSGVATVVRRASTVGSSLRRLSLFSASQDLSPKVSDIAPFQSDVRKRSTSEAPSETSPVQAIIEEDEETEDNLSSGCANCVIPVKAKTSSKVVKIEPEIDGNRNIKPIEKLDSAETGEEIDQEFEADLKQYLKECLPSDDISSDEPCESYLTKMCNAWRSVHITAEGARYTIAGIVFLFGVISLIITLLPGAAAREESMSADFWSKLENQLSPFLSMRHHKPPPT